MRVAKVLSGPTEIWDSFFNMNEPANIFAAAETGNVVSKDDYDRQIVALRLELLNLQYDLRSSDFSVVVLITGDDHPGVVKVLRILHEWMDARYLQAHVMFSTDEAEYKERPRFKKYWRRLPPVGRIGLFLGAWPAATIQHALEEDWTHVQFDAALDEQRRFEEMLVDDGTLVLKFWLHLPKKVLKGRLAAAADDPDTHWDIAQYDWEFVQQYGAAVELLERLVRRTSTTTAAWHIIESTDSRYCNLSVARTIAQALKPRLSSPPEKPTRAPATDPLGGRSLLDQIDLQASVTDKHYEVELADLQARLNRLSHRTNEAGVGCVFVFEGVDAAGKGGAIRRLVAALPVQHVKVMPISAPNEVERAHHYLWRFWSRLPRSGETTIFDRSWYGRVLVERVEGFAEVEQWRRAYGEINDFEATILGSGMVLCKFWLQIDADEQARRFEERARTPYKKYKLTAEDLRNRAKWDAYEVAAHDMISNTSTSYAPWHLIAANDKRHARLEVLRIVVQHLDRGLELADDSKRTSKKKKKKKKK